MYADFCSCYHTAYVCACDCQLKLSMPDMQCYFKITVCYFKAMCAHIKHSLINYVIREKE